VEDNSAGGGEQIDQRQNAAVLRNVGLRRSEKWILRGIDWTIPIGSCVGLLGPNGSGKSTLARILGCHLWPTEGQCSILGEPFGQANLPELRKRIRLVQPAGPYEIDSSLTARQVVLTGFFATLAFYDLPTAAMRETADRMLTTVGLDQVADHAYATLSSGERMRSLLARAMVSEPGLLLLDEPTAGMDILGREQVLATMEALTRSAAKIAIVLITHHVEELPPATSRVLLLSEGRVAAEGMPAEVLRSDILSKVYRCPVQVTTTEGRYYLRVHPRAWENL
jgi:iron complex transport system ATP-binding protein